MDISRVKLGKRPASRWAWPELSDYITHYGMPTPPPNVHWGSGLPYAMDGNDKYGDCVEAAYAHQQEVWLTHTKDAKYTLGEADCVAAYEALCPGFSPGPPVVNDNGTDMTDAVKYWKRTGMGGLKISGWANVNPAKLLDVQNAVNIFGGLYIGLNLPMTAQSQTEADMPWTVIKGAGNDPGSWGGHCVPVVGYTSQWVYCVTWGAVQAMSWGFFTGYCDEAFALLSRDWLMSGNTSPSGLAWAALEADMALV